MTEDPGARIRPVPLVGVDVGAADGGHGDPYQDLPGVHVAQGFDFADVTAVETGEGIVLVDTTTSRAHLRAVLAELRADPGFEFLCLVGDS